MSDLLADLLQKKDFHEPTEASAIKQYVLERYNTKAGVQLCEKDIIIVVPSSALAGTLRYEVTQLQRVAGTTKKLVFRIGGQY